MENETLSPTEIMDPIGQAIDVPSVAPTLADVSPMDILLTYVNQAVDFVWGPFLLIPLLLGVGIYLMIGLRFMPIRYLFPAFRHLWHGRRSDNKASGELSPFNALMTTMAATVGVGNIVGVATAILIGGPGAIFWMWCTALLGMATKYCEAVLAVRFREVTPRGSYVGGPMYYIRKGLGAKWGWLAATFAVFGAVASFGIGNMTQTNAIAKSLQGHFQVPEWVTALALLLLVGVVLIGGVRRIGRVAGVLVPFMAIAYIIVGLLIMVLHYDQVPQAFEMIFVHAFSPESAVGGLTGAAIIVAMRAGIARGMFSNEAGLGSSPIAHATAITNSPVRQGFLGMLEPFLDTVVVCTITAVVILISGEWAGLFGSDEQGAVLASVAFGNMLPGIGEYTVVAGLVLFAYSTVIGWYVYGERCVIYLFGDRASLPFRILFTCIVPVGALLKLNMVWALANLFNGLMALPNLVALVLLSPVVFKLTRDYFDDPAHHYRRRDWRFFYRTSGNKHHRRRDDA